MFHLLFRLGGVLGLLSLLANLQTASAASAPVQLTELSNRVRIEIGGELFTEYRFNDAPHVYFYPVIGPGNVPMTRNAPMKKVAYEDADHPHHRSLWFSHGAVNGADLWAETDKSGSIVHDKLLEVKSGKESGWLKAAHSWKDREGNVVCTDVTTFRVYADKEIRKFDYEITITAPAGREVTLGDTKEGTMAIRLAETMRLKANKFNAGKPTGHIVMDTGVRDGETWGKRAKWCDYHGPVEGKIMGVAILDHPQNPRHPTWWHVRDYGLFAANPFGVHDFEKKPAGEGNLVIPAGKSITFRYRFILHPGDEKEGKIADHYRQYVSTASKPSAE